MNGIAIECFCCSGGMAEGFRRAGIDFDLAVDKEKDHCDSYEANLGHRPVQIDIHDLVRLARLGWSPSVWLFVADPPCTPWSSGGKRRGLDDPRDCLMPTIELIKLLRPECYLIGNVPGLEHETNAWVLEATIGQLAREGYCTADYAQFDAADFGVPQHRLRPFWFGHRRGTPCITWPSATHGPPSRNEGLPGIGLLPWVTAGEALADLPEKLLGRRCRVAEHGRAHPNDIALEEPARTQNSNPEGCSVLRLHPRHPTSTMDAPARTVTTVQGGGSSGNVLLGLKEELTFPVGGSGKSKMSFVDKPARTVTGSDGRAGNVLADWMYQRPSMTVSADGMGRMPNPGRNEPGEKRTFDNAIVLSELARARLQSFPDRWVFVGKHKRTRNQQIGMAMPPPLAEAIARSIVVWRELAMRSAGNGEGVG
jgi:site-specific DNA-cytosine methylase